ncbi:MAG: hypothetical protein ACYCZR_00085 [Burkholderiales bacterium]
MKDFQVVSSLVQLKALVAGLYGRIDALAVAAQPVVDFAVDMFDRSDSATLGSYWEGEEKFSIIAGTVISASATTAVATPLVTVSGMVPSNTVSAYVTGAISSAVYRATLSTPDMSVKTVSREGDGLVGYDRFYASWYRVFGGTEVVVIEKPIQIGDYGGACIASSTGSAVDAVSVARCIVPQTDTRYEFIDSFGVQTLEVRILPGAPRSMTRVVHGNELYSKVPAAGPYAGPYAGAVLISGSIPISRSGGVGAENVLPVGGDVHVLMECTGDTITASVGGELVYTKKSTLVPQRSRDRAGIAAPAINTVGLADSLGVNPGGTREFKVWRNDIPEPPNETGHGTYTNGRWQYTDKYHTPVTDASGTVIRNEDGTVASYIYDPEA